MSENIVKINGHEVDTDVYPAGRFFDGETGEPITDEEWDEQKRRLNAEPIPADEIEYDDPEDVID